MREQFPRVELVATTLREVLSANRHRLLRGWEPERAMQFGWATGALAVTFVTDHAVPADEDQVWSIRAGNARVLR